MAQRLNLSIELGKQTQNRANDTTESSQIAIIVLGDFSGGGSGNPSHLTESSLQQVDIDSFEQLMSRLKPSMDIVLQESGQALSLDFENLDDFHPDQLYKRLPLFQSGLSSNQSSELANPRPPNDPQQQQQNESDQQTLARLLGERSVSNQQGAPTGSAMSQAKQSLIESVVLKLAKEASQEHDCQESDHSAVQLESATTLMRQLLHHPSFQALESHWRGLDWLLRDIEPTDGFKLYVLDITRHALQVCLRQGEDIHQSDLYRLIHNQIDKSSLAEHKLLLICDERISATMEEIDYLKGLAHLADAVDAHLIAEADEQFIDTEDSSRGDLGAWHAFRNTKLASRVTLALPRVLFRLPYGQNYDPIEAFPFEELDQNWCTSELLWGNPAYPLAVLIAMRNLSSDSTNSPMLMDCPAFAFRKDDEQHLQASTEHLYQEHEIKQILSLGLIPLIGSRHSNTIQLPWL